MSALSDRISTAYIRAQLAEACGKSNTRVRTVYHHLLDEPGEEVSDPPLESLWQVVHPSWMLEISPEMMALMSPQKTPLGDTVYDRMEDSDDDPG